MAETIDVEATARRIADLTDVDSLRQVAAQWVNARTGEPYSAMHVNRTVKAFNSNVNVTPRPRFRAAYNAVANAVIVSRFSVEVSRPLVRKTLQ